MSRPLRIEFSGALYHVTLRNKARGVIYCDDTDRRNFLALLDEVCKEVSQRSGHLSIMKTPDV